MKRLHSTGWLLALACAGGTMFCGFRLFSHQREQRRMLEQQQTQLEKQLETVRRDDQNLINDLIFAQAQLAKLPDSANANSGFAERERENEIAAWLRAVKRLKQLFDERPEQRIPEMRLLSDRDWLRLAQTAEFADGANIRKMMAAVRDTATGHYISALKQTLSKFVEANGTEPPSSTLALIPYLKDPADADILRRFEIAKRSYPPTDRPQNWIVREIAPVDEDYDQRYEVDAGVGGGVSSYGGGPLAWIPDLPERTMHAFQAYVAAHHGKVPPDEVSATLPYFNPPLDPGMVAKLLKSEQTRKQK